jgi:hypothetical protein
VACGTSVAGSTRSLFRWIDAMGANPTQMSLGRTVDAPGPRMASSDTRHYFKTDTSSYLLHPGRGGGRRCLNSAEILTKSLKKIEF